LQSVLLAAAGGFCPHEAIFARQLTVVVSAATPAAAVAATVAVVVAAASVDPTAVAADPKESVHSIGSYCQPASRRQSWPLPAT